MYLGNCLWVCVLVPPRDLSYLQRILHQWVTFPIQKPMCGVFHDHQRYVYNKRGPWFRKEATTVVVAFWLVVRWWVWDIFWSIYVKHRDFFSTAHPSLFKSLSFHLFTVKYAKYIRKYIGTIFYIQCTHNKVPSMGLTPCDNA